MPLTKEQRIEQARKAGHAKKGKKSKKTIDRNLIMEQWKNRASKIAGNLLSAQTLVAMGTHTLMRIDEVTEYRDTGKTNKDGSPSRTKYTTKKFVVVDNQEEIERVMNEFADVDGAGVVDDKYYFITHKEPQNNAIDSILNRTFGRPVETIEHSGRDGKPLIIKLDS